jgi:hypothetical protein
MKELFISLTERDLIIKNSNEACIYNFSKYGISIYDSKMCGEFIVEILKENFSNAASLSILLSEHFTFTKETFDEEVKMSQNLEQTESTDFWENNGNISNKTDDYLPDNSLICYTTEYLSYDKNILNYNTIPVLTKYYKRTQSFHLKTDMCYQLRIVLEKAGYVIMNMIPLSLFNSRQNVNQQANICSLLSVYENTSFISIILNGKTIYQKQINAGLFNLIQKVSDYFNISLHNSRILIDKYGFVFLPAKYNDFVIDIPIYNNILKEIELPELSYVIREEIKRITDKLLFDNRAGENILINTGNICTFSRCCVNGFDKLVRMLSGMSYFEYDFTEIDFDECNKLSESACSFIAQAKRQISISNVEMTKNSKTKAQVSKSPSLSKAFNFLEKQVGLLLES